METITFTGILLRFLFALVLVLTTFNPSGFSYAHWFGRQWIALVITSIVLAIGMSWSHIRRRLSGQADVDEIETR